MKDKLLIIGASGHGKVAADTALKMNKWRSVAFVDDNDNIHSSLGIKVVGNISSVFKYLDDYDFFVAIGNNHTREKLQKSLEAQGASIATLIHPNAILGQEVEVASGTIVMAGAVINCSTKIGKGCIINTGSTIDHDNLIENFVHISPGAHLAGTVKVGRTSWLGIGSVVSNNITIVGGSNVGAGAVVIKDITAAGTYVGVPARKLDDNTK